MNKQEFLDRLNILKYSGSYNSENNYWDKERGFDKCKEEVIKLAYQLDEQGLTFEAYNLFRQQTNDLTAVYTELFKLQKELFNANKQLRNIEAERQHYERLRTEEIENIRQGVIAEVIDCIHGLPILDGKAVTAKGYIDFAELEKILSEKLNIEFPKIS